MGRSGCSPQVLVDSRGPKVCDDLRNFVGFVVLVWFSSTQVLVDSRGVLQFWVVLEESSSFALFWSTPVLPFSGVLQFALVALLPFLSALRF